MKLFYINKVNQSLAVVLPKKLYLALGWKPGDVVEFDLGRDKCLVVRRKEL